MWFTRFSDSASAYEIEYGYWIPGTAKDALLGVFLFGQEDEVMRVFANVTTQLGGSSEIEKRSPQSSAKRFSWGLLHDQVTVSVTRPDWPVWS